MNIDSIASPLSGRQPAAKHAAVSGTVPILAGRWIIPGDYIQWYIVTDQTQPISGMRYGLGFC